MLKNKPSQIRRIQSHRTDVTKTKHRKSHHQPLGESNPREKEKPSKNQTTISSRVAEATAAAVSYKHGRKCTHKRQSLPQNLNLERKRPLY